jgi:hypothetical protein
VARTKTATERGNEGRRGTVEHARGMIEELTRRARAGHPEAVGRVLAWLEAYPELRPLVRELGSLAERAEGAWVTAAAFGDPLAESAVRDQVAAMKGELLPAAAGVLERVLATALVVAHLAHHRAAVQAARPAAHPAVAAARDRALSAAQKRLLAAVRGWELVARKKRKGVKPKRRLKLFQADEDAA